MADYLVTARRVLAPMDDDFCRRQGYFAGQRQKAGVIGRMVATPEIRMKMAPTVWHMFYDIGRLKVVGGDPATAAGQIHGRVHRPRRLTASEGRQDRLPS